MALPLEHALTHKYTSLEKEKEKFYLGEEKARD